jgi:hypothetical protein
VTLPSFMNPQPAPAMVDKPKRIGGGPPPFANFPFVQQQLTLWCWAAVAVAISVSKGRAIQQCQVAAAYGPHSTVASIRQALTSHACCPPSPSVNVSGELEVALTSIGMTCNVEDIDQNTAAEIPRNLAANSAPLGVYIQWDHNGGGHFIAIVGVDPVDGSFQIYDPSELHENSSYFVTKSPSSLTDYDGMGRWDGVYYLA